MHVFEDDSRYSKNLRQFIENVKVSDGTFEIFRVQPQPERKTNLPPIVFLPGWGATPKSYQDTLAKFAEGGRDMISLRYLPNLPKINSIFRRDRAKNELLEEAEQLRQVLGDKLGLSEVDVIAHSRGAALAVELVKASIKNRDKSRLKFRKIAFVGPGSFRKRDSILRIGLGFGADMTSDVWKMHIAKVTPPSMQRRLRNALIEEMKYVSSYLPWMTRQAALLGTLHNFDDVKMFEREGIGVTIIYAQDDKVFPPDSPQNPEFSKRHIFSGNHFSLISNSEEYAEELGKILN
ncbi:MAG TPA: alpha/beta hydrolase [Patescibacteria group bacterium]